MTAEQAYHALCAYTLEHARRDPAFVHQHVVDAYAAQHAGPASKPIGIAFALIGLCLHVERGFTGKQVQQVHMRLAQRKRTWPSFPLPADRGSMTCLDVLSQTEGPERDRAISAWCRIVWDAFAEAQPAVRALLHDV
jgi:hypothetical protein